jgi:hypothetical protein
VLCGKGEGVWKKQTICDAAPFTPSLSSSIIPVLPSSPSSLSFTTNIQLRNLLANHAKEIIIFHARLGRPNPILNLPDVLNPTKRVGNSDAITTESAFLASIQAGIVAARSIKPDQNLINAMAAKAAAVRPPPPPGTAGVQRAGTPGAPGAPAAGLPAPAGTPAATAAPTPTATPAAATPSPASGTPAPAAPAAAPAPAAAAPAATAPAAAPAGAAGAAAAAAPQLLTTAQLKELMAMPQEARNARLESEPILKRRFIFTCQYYSRRIPQHQQAQAAAQAQGAGAAASPVTSATATPAT